NKIVIKMKNLQVIRLLFMVYLLLNISCKKTATLTPDTANTNNNQSFVPITLQSKAKFHIGAAIDPTLLQTNTAYREIIKTEYNSITVENMMKMGSIQPNRGQFSYDKANIIVDYALQNRKRVHGHTLVWHESVPDWVKNFQGDSLAWENLFKTHIQTLVSYYKGKVTAWDVVNEAVNDNGTLRGTIWSNQLGKDYVARAFQYARQADPDVLLFYNEYGQEYSTAKLNAVIAMAEDFKKRGIPIDGLGLQMHININTSDVGIQNAINESAKTGLKIHISELDIQLNPDNQNISQPTLEMLERQKIKYRTIVKAYNTLPANQKYGITTWNVGDADSWVRSYLKRNDFPLPFNINYQRKPAYDGILEGLD
nr:endo-1,4-beta-xylanase [Thermoflexibacter sp.]